jgi:hypothetical protein
VLVTGSSKALGAETARRFAAEGAKVVVNGRDEQAVENVAAFIRTNGGQCIGIIADVTSAAELGALQGKIRVCLQSLAPLPGARRAGSTVSVIETASAYSAHQTKVDPESNAAV